MIQALLDAMFNAFKVNMMGVTCTLDSPVPVDAEPHWIQVLFDFDPSEPIDVECVKADTAGMRLAEEIKKRCAGRACACVFNTLPCLPDEVGCLCYALSDKPQGVCLRVIVFRHHGKNVCEVDARFFILTGVCL